MDYPVFELIEEGIPELKNINIYSPGQRLSGINLDTKHFADIKKDFKLAYKSQTIHNNEPLFVVSELM